MAIEFGDSRIDSEEVGDRINELQNMLDEEELFSVQRVRNGSEIARFATEAEAEAFIDENDYDTSKVNIIEEDSDVDTDELDELRKIDQWGNDNFSDWGSITVINGDYIDYEDYAREYIENNYPTRNNDAYQVVVDYVDFSELGERLLEDCESASYGPYSMYTYYAL